MRLELEVIKLKSSFFRTKSTSNAEVVTRRKCRTIFFFHKKLIFYSVKLARGEGLTFNVDL